jgi:hypothetical protein
MLENRFSNFSIKYREPVNEDNYYKNYIVFVSDELDYEVRIQNYFLCLDMAKQITSDNEEIVKAGLKWYKEEIINHANKITLK